MRFKIDENLPTEAKQLLLQAGYDAATVEDELLSGASDSDIARICRREQRAIISLDLDFVDIRHFPPQDYSGLILLRIPRQDRNTVLSIIERLIFPLKPRCWIDGCGS